MGKSTDNKRKLGEYAENLGELAGPPATRIDGSALRTGDTYYDTSTGARVYNGADWATLGGGAGGSVAWVDVTGKPSTFAPSAHTHVIADTTGLQAALDAKQAALVSGTNIKTINGTSLLGSGDLVVGAGGGTGTVTSVAVTTFNGFAGSVANPTTTPSITLTTTLTGLLKGNGTAMLAAVAGTDFQSPIGTISGLAKGNGANALTAAVAGTDFQSPIGTISGLAKGNGANALTAAVAGTDYVAPSGALGTPSSGTLTNCTADGTNAVGFRNVPQNSQSAAYTAVLADAGKHLLHPSADTTARTYTIPANSSVAYPIGTALTFVNQASAGVVTIAITTDTMRLAGAGTTGSRTLAANGMATALKITATEWIISGTGLT